MAKGTPRCAISIRRVVYERISAYAKNRNISISRAVEDAVVPLFEGWKPPPHHPWRRMKHAHGIPRRRRAAGPAEGHDTSPEQARPLPAPARCERTTSNVVHW